MSLPLGAAPMANTDAREYEIMTIFRSDGADSGPGYWSDTAKKPNGVVAVRKSGMNRLDDMDPRFVEWRLKLGMLLKQELSPAPQDGLAWYMPFPKGYWLYEKSKHFFVSGYPIKGKLYKTPQDFALHLIWLLSGSESRQDCACIFCNVTSETKPAPAPAPVSATAASTATATATAASTAASTVAFTTTSASNTSSDTAAATTGKISTIKSRKPTKSPSTPSGPPKAYNPAFYTVPASLFRTGELVWYSHESSWRLGLITLSEAMWHTITPIGHSSSTLQKINKAPASIRPFLAFSVPAVAQETLRGLAFDEIPWENRIKPLQASGAIAAVESLMLDASKLAALKINRSYSFFNRVGSTNGTTSYKGIFLGAERIHVDDILRINQNMPGIAAPATNNVMDVMYFHLKGIYTMVASPGTIFFHGDVVKLISPTNPPNPPLQLIPATSLPPALFEEATYRNNSTSVAAWKLQWGIVTAGCWRKEPDVKGRFYSMPRLGPILLGQVMKEGPRDKLVPALNGRLDVVLPGNMMGESRSRGETVKDTVTGGAATGGVGIFRFDEREVQFENDE